MIDTIAGSLNSGSTPRAAPTCPECCESSFCVVEPVVDLGEQIINQYVGRELCSVDQCGDNSRSVHLAKAGQVAASDQRKGVDGLEVASEAYVGTRCRTQSWLVGAEGCDDAGTACVGDRFTTRCDVVLPEHTVAAATGPARESGVHDRQG